MNDAALYVGILGLIISILAAVAALIERRRNNRGRRT